MKGAERSSAIAAASGFDSLRLIGVNMKTRITAVWAITALAILTLTGNAWTQQPEDWSQPPREARSPADSSVVLSRSASGSESRGTPTAASLRQARAMYEAQQRLRRIERNRWMGHEPLRPSFNAVPMMTSRYSPNRVVYIPYYIRTR